jgi:exportin-7
LLTSKIQNSKHEILEIQNLFVELLGISKALNNEKLFIEFFEIIHAEIWEVLRVLKEGKAGFAVFKHVMKFFIELTENRNSRIKFEVNEPYGLVLFRSLADLVSIYCSFPESNENQVNSRVKVLLRLVNNLLRGGYICYGVFEIYNDPCYVNTIIICFQEILKTCEIQVNLI